MTRIAGRTRTRQGLVLGNVGSKQPEIAETGRGSPYFMPWTLLCDCTPSGISLNRAFVDPEPFPRKFL